MHYDSSYIITLLTWSTVSDPSSGKIHLCCKILSLKNHADTFCEQGEISKWGAWSRSAPSSVSGPHLPSRLCAPEPRLWVSYDEGSGAGPQTRDQAGGSVYLYLRGISAHPWCGHGIALGGTDWPARSSKTRSFLQNTHMFSPILK